MTIEIRACTAADAPALSLVGQATFLESYADVLPGADILAHCAKQHAAGVYAEWLRSKAHRLWIAEMAEGKAPVGYAVLASPDLPVTASAGDLELKRIYLLHRFQGAGLGKGLLEAVSDGARAAGARRLLLGVYGRNRRAIAFYARQGFIQVGVRKFEVGANTYDDLVLALGL